MYGLKLTQNPIIACSNIRHCYVHTWSAFWPEDLLGRRDGYFVQQVLAHGANGSDLANTIDRGFVSSNSY